MKLKISDAEYFAIDACSASKLKTIYNKSVMHSLIEKPPTESMIIGSAFHCLALEPMEFDKRYAVYPETINGEKPDYRKTEHKRFKERFEAEMDGKQALSHLDYTNLLGMVESLSKHPLSRIHLVGGEAESVIVHEMNEPEATKIKMDYVKYSDHIILDLKSCQDASLNAIKRDIYKFGYDIQAAWYSAQYHCETGEASTFLFAFVENVFPYGVCYVQLSPEVLAEGMRKVGVAYKDYLEYRATGIAKGYSDDVVLI